MTTAARSGLFAGSTWHRRRRPVEHAFRYRTWSVLVDLDELDDIDRRVRLLSVGRRGLCALRSEDHLLPLHVPGVRSWLTEQGVDGPVKRVSLLTSPRVLGYVFNPLSLWWCHGPDDRLTAVVAEVHNTYGGRHAYALVPDHAGRASADKELYVSPFFDVDGRYAMRLRESHDQFAVHIGYDRGDERVFDATWTGRRQPLTDRRLGRLMLAHPLWALRVSLLIHWQGIRLWLRRLPVIPRPATTDGTGTADKTTTATTDATAVDPGDGPAATPRPADEPGDLPPPAPRAPVRAAAVRRLLTAAVPRLPAPLEVQLADGTVVSSQGAQQVTTDPVPRLRVRSPRFFDRLGAGGKLGLGESYMAGEWTADDLPGVLTALASGIESVPAGLWRAMRRVGSVRAVARPNTLEGSARNISHHYDLSNDLFTLFLDDSMTYSSAVFQPRDDLETAQARKRDLLLDPLDLGPDDHLLEIGTGWGSLAIHAAQRSGCRVTTVTLSEEQAAYARERIEREGLANRIEVVVRDYREVTGTYDAMVSVEMLEAVGEEWWPTYFRSVEELLRPGGRAAIQTITMTHDRWLAARQGHGWIHRYIFPGGEIPSIKALSPHLAKAGLAVTSRRDIGRHYVETLRQWRERFLAQRPEVHRLGFDATFVRMWDFYLAYCEAGFRTRQLGASQLVLTRAADTAMTRRARAAAMIGDAA